MSAVVFPNADPSGTETIHVGRASGTLSSNPKIAAYSTVVNSINESRMKHKPINVIQKFESVSEMLAKDAQQQQIHKCWDLLGQMLGSRIMI
jgi:hypothetical protein